MSRNPFEDGGSDDGVALHGIGEGASSPPSTDASFVGGSQLVGLNDQGMHRQKEELMLELDKQFPGIEPSLNGIYFEKHVMGHVRASFYDGISMQSVEENVTEPKIGITFMAGADTPQVNLMEMVGMTQTEPEQKDAIWRVNTAGALLRNFEVDRDMTVIQTDNTAAVIARARRHRTMPNGSFYERNIPSTSLVQRGREDRTVTIDSDNVKIVNDLSQGRWDLESTLIEVDQSSLVALMFNYRHLIHRGGPALTFTATIKLLDMMIEDARRLCIRSPILFRMSTRRHIIHSKNTRYGVDHGTMFHTLTTSKGIKNIICRSSAYFNSLSSSGNTDKSQEAIRPRFLQMLVLLLALLNDEDLGEIREFLETTYRIDADRQHIEMLILKVLPLMSINPKIFLHAMVIAFDGPTVHPHPTDQTFVWHTFIQRVLQLNYVLPGVVEQLGQPNLSWLVKWPEEGIKDSSIFNNLQYAGKNRTINDIPPINFHLDTSGSELTVVFTNGQKYLVAVTDVENIVRMTPGKYSITEAADSVNASITSTNAGRTFDLEITEFVATDALTRAIQRVNSVVSVLNPFIASTRDKKTLLKRFNSGRGGSFFGGNKEVSEEQQQRSSDGIQPFLEVKGCGRLTSHTAILHDQYLAMAYKIDGRKIGRRDLIRNLAGDLRKLRSTVAAVEGAMSDFMAGRRTGLPQEFRQQLLSLRQTLVEIRGLITQAEEKKGSLERNQLQLDDEPISKVLYPSGAERNANNTWHDYKAWYVKSDNVLYVEAQRQVVQSVFWVSDEIVEIVFENEANKYFVSPLKAGVAEHERLDEVKEGDRAMLVGQYMVVVEPLEGDGTGHGYGQGGYGIGIGNGNGNRNGHPQQAPSRTPVPQGVNGYRRPPPITDQSGYRRPVGQDQNGYRRAPIPEQSGLRRMSGSDQNRRLPPVHEIGVDEDDNSRHIQISRTESYPDEQLPERDSPTRYTQFLNRDSPRRTQYSDQNCYVAPGQPYDHAPQHMHENFAYPLRPAANGQQRYVNGNGGGQGAGRDVIPMATESLVNWMKITGVEQQVASRRGMNRRKEILSMRSAIR